MANINDTCTWKHSFARIITNEGESYFTAFCTCISKFVADIINYAFSLAFTTSPDGIPQPNIIPNDDDDEINELQWYTCACASK
jgi:hypothetical protein